ncbi:accessory Sec system protein Asp2 [Lacticaseibacillus chiayiensis]|uniref:accessory Sec system protein Asp2 n=1 Tax=Lacticaseibacillus chiayiensis TaxID=2100821 RepID=UPI001FD26240|nr:accessory Sec system protein Asp2 [Lacticaseibacillus chiayiensis]
MKAKKRNTKKVIQVGENALPLETLLVDEFEYIWINDADTPPVKEHALFKLNRLNPYYQDALFLIDQTSPWCNRPEILTALPANQILYDQAVEMARDCQKIMQLEGAHQLDFSDVAALATTINKYFFGNQAGYRMPPSWFTIAPGFEGSIRQQGQSYHEFKVNLDHQWHLAAYPNVAQWVPAHMLDTVLVEFERLDPSVHLKAVVTQYDLETNEFVRSDEKVDDELRQEFKVEGGEKGCNMQLTVFASGSGTFHIGQFHVRRSRGPYGEFLLNDRRLIEPAGMNTELAIYFDAGDLKPPLNVYFSGYRSAEGFEGNYMMRMFHGPFLLIADSRLEGGAFYLGSEALQQQVMAAIRETLKRLHFKPNELILSGLSMGTFGALYYGARLAPSAIVVGKPLVNVGTIAKGTHLTRPGDFATSLDMLLFYEGDLSRADKLNEQFWRVFKKADFSHTTFAFAYMMNDDYDPHAFQQVRQYLKKAEPMARILSKGLVGRHNDDTNGIVNWFVMQFRHLLHQQYGRNVD